MNTVCRSVRNRSTYHSLDARLVRIHVDREVEEVGDEQVRAPAPVQIARLQDVQSLEDHDVGAIHHLLLAGDDVVEKCE